MDKQTILEKSRLENRRGGEYEKQNKWFAEYITSGVILAGLIFLTILSIIRRNDISAYLFLMLLSACTESAVFAYKKKSVGYAVVAVICGICAITGLIQILNGGTMILSLHLFN